MRDTFPFARSLASSEPKRLPEPLTADIRASGVNRLYVMDGGGKGSGLGVMVFTKDLGGHQGRWDVSDGSSWSAPVDGRTEATDRRGDAGAWRFGVSGGQAVRHQREPAVQVEAP